MLLSYTNTRRLRCISRLASVRIRPEEEDICYIAKGLDVHLRGQNSTWLSHRLSLRMDRFVLGKPAGPTLPTTNLARIQQLLECILPADISKACLAIQNTSYPIRRS